MPPCSDGRRPCRPWARFRLRETAGPSCFKRGDKMSQARVRLGAAAVLTAMTFVAAGCGSSNSSGGSSNNSNASSSGSKPAATATQAAAPQLQGDIAFNDDKLAELRDKLKAA